MNAQETTQLLARIQVLDNRQVDALTIEAWRPLMVDLDYREAVDAVNEHFRTSTEYLKPAHIRRLVASRRRALLPPVDGTVPAHAHRWLANGTCIYPGCIERTGVAS